MIRYSFSIKKAGNRRLWRRSPARKLARPRGFEPPAYRLGGGRSIQLSYGRIPYPFMIPVPPTFVNLLPRIGRKTGRGGARRRAHGPAAVKERMHLKILAIGDVCGAAGRKLIKTRLSALRRETGADLVIVNGENANDNGRGLSPDTAEDFFYAGADVITLGNHAFNDRRIYDYLEDRRYIIRPENGPARAPGCGSTVIDCAGRRVCVCNLLGRVDMDYRNASPFEAADRILKTTAADLFVFDMHAEATSEKRALGYYLDGRAAVVFGTHTHVATRDLQIMPRGTGYITDLGMTGASVSVLGVRPERSIDMFLGEPYVRYEYSDAEPLLQGALFTLDDSGRCIGTQAIDFK